jgi:hypothetical protein
MPAAVMSSRPRISGSVSFSSALRMSGSIAAFASASARVAARRSLRSSEESLNAPSALATAPRRRLFATTSSLSLGNAIGLPVETSDRLIATHDEELLAGGLQLALGERLQQLRPRSDRPRPRARRSPSIFSSPSPKASFSSAPGSSA